MDGAIDRKYSCSSRAQVVLVHLMMHALDFFVFCACYPFAGELSAERLETAENFERGADVLLAQRAQTRAAVGSSSISPSDARKLRASRDEVRETWNISQSFRSGMRSPILILFSVI